MRSAGLALMCLGAYLFGILTTALFFTTISEIGQSAADSIGGLVDLLDKL